MEGFVGKTADIWCAGKRTRASVADQLHSEDGFVLQTLQLGGEVARKGDQPVLKPARPQRDFILSWLLCVKKFIRPPQSRRLLIV